MQFKGDQKLEYKLSVNIDHVYYTVHIRRELKGKGVAQAPLEFPLNL